MTDTPPTAGLQPLIVSAPFGNYIQPDGATATLGTFTVEKRGGRVWRILKTVRYYPRIKAWVNQIGLRNPGVAWLVDKVRHGKIDPSNKIVSIHGFADAEWYELLEWMADLKPMAVELNMSCPNVGEIDWPTDLFGRAVSTGLPIIAKLPPVNYELLLTQAVEAGVRCVHCCNTLPTPRGGVSGKPLKPVALQCIRDVRQRHRDLAVIGGGGITTTQDIDAYAEAGAQRFAIGTKVMNPIYLFRDSGVRPLIAHAHEIVAAATGQAADSEPASLGGVA